MMLETEFSANYASIFSVIKCHFFQSTAISAVIEFLISSHEVINLIGRTNGAGGR